MRYIHSEKLFHMKEEEFKDVVVDVVEGKVKVIYEDYEYDQDYLSMMNNDERPIEYDEFRY